MALDRNRVSPLLKTFDFCTLFIEELGWDHHTQRLPILIGEDTFTLEAVAHKRGVGVFTCGPSDRGTFPDYATRRKIDRRVTRAVHEHLIIYIDADRTIQVWQWVKRELGKPTASREHTFHRHQSGEALIQKLDALVVNLKDEEQVTQVDVTSRIRATFDVDRVTRRFYDRFKDEHETFLGFLQGIPDEDMERWYVSVMLNRLMFIYFIQRKGFLGNSDPDYLRHKLEESKARGTDRYYREFLCPLFFDGFAKQKTERSDETNILLGDIPYLNGGIFLPHEVEERYGREINVPDKAFEKLFDFFDGYQWHLDERPLRNDNEINPDVLGYIFEKYINQKQMGAYYTKEDITGYISRNTIIPFLFDSARKDCKIAFEGERPVWALLREDLDRYIYPALRHGVTADARSVPPEPLEEPHDLPPEIAAGIDDVSQRSEWNTPAPDEYALPTEIWREVVARRQRYDEVRSKLANGEVNDINDLITLNLDIEQFALDVIQNSEGPELLRAFWKAIAGKRDDKGILRRRGISILDPACGSGAFLFAALNILEPLYEACLDRMEAFVEELGASDGASSPNKYSDFRRTLDRMEKHHNQKYFIYKSIIVNNLYGVDIMDEAVEICKLRLFLKLAAQVDDGDHIEPLPDIDFNIRAGNTLVGYVSEDEVRKALAREAKAQMGIRFGEDTEALRAFEARVADAQQAFDAFRRKQLTGDGWVPPEDKAEVERRFGELDAELNRCLATDYGVHPSKFSNESKYEAEFRKWRDSHKPFHWFVDFYGIMNEGGFDVAIGNPPYVELRKVRDYSICGYETEPCGNLYALMMERCTHLCGTRTRLGLIIPVSIVCTGRMESLRQIAVTSFDNMWLSNYDTIPCTLFSGIVQRNTIVLGRRCPRKLHARVFSTALQKWLAEERAFLFQKTSYAELNADYDTDLIPKVSNLLEVNVLSKIRGHRKSILSYTASDADNSVFYKRRWSYFLLFVDAFESIVMDDGSLREQSDVKTLEFDDSLDKYAYVALLSSGTFYFHYCVFGDYRHLNVADLASFRFDNERGSMANNSKLAALGRELMESYRAHIEWRECNYKRSIGRCRVPFYRQGRSKHIIDKIDECLVEHYNFTAEELDFIINYDIKYRMGLG